MYSCYTSYTYAAQYDAYFPIGNKDDVFTKEIGIFDCKITIIRKFTYSLNPLIIGRQSRQLSRSIFVI